MQLKQYILLLSLNILAIFFIIIENFFANKYKKVKKNIYKRKYLFYLQKIISFVCMQQYLIACLELLSKQLCQRTFKRNIELN